MNEKILSVLALISQIATIAFCWTLAEIGLNELYRVRHVTTTRFHRSFLCIESDSGLHPTLIESRWTEDMSNVSVRVFPHPRSHADYRPLTRKNCRRIQNARWTEVDSLKRLWVLDVGNNNTKCPPKLLVFDLIRNDIEILRIDCHDYLNSADQLLAIKLGPRPTHCQMEKYIYFVVRNNPNLIVFDIVQQQWRYVALIYRKFETAEIFSIIPHDIAFARATEMLISDDNGLLYRSFDAMLTDPSEDIELEMLGTLLGRSKSMIVDSVGLLYYMMPESGALVRSPLKANLTSEDNEVIFMTSREIHQILFGTDGTVWLLSDQMLSPDDHCHPVVY